MINTIHIERLAVHANHGVLPQERIVGAEFHVTLEADVEVLPGAYLSDNLEGTVSYADMVVAIREEVRTPSMLLEHLAYRVGRRILADFPPVRSLRLRIDKENPPCGVCADSIGVSIRMSR